MALFKQAIAKKSIDIENYKPRFGSDYSNDLRGLAGHSITFFKLKRFCDIFDIRASVTFEDKKNAPNPIGEKLTTCINDTMINRRRRWIKENLSIISNKYRENSIQNCLVDQMI